LILTVTLNTAIDRTYRVDGFCLDVVHRPEECWIVAGGKGVNVARVVTRLGGAAVATGFVGGHNGEFIAESLREEGIRDAFVRVRGESRTCIAAVDHLRRTQTEINEVGPVIGSDEAGKLRANIALLLEDLRPFCMTLSGSAPPGVPEGVYADLVELAAERGVRCALDSSGEHLRRGARSEPWLIKPNRLELGHLTGIVAADPPEAARAARSVLSARTELVAVTLGSDGAVGVTRDEAFWVKSPAVPFISAVGSGDSFLAALLVSLERGESFRQSCRVAAGAGAANACRYGAGFIDASEVNRLAAETEVTDL
jgi:1-phosphofructokinase family hexose kinase